MSKDKDPLLPRYEDHRPGMLSTEFTAETERLFNEIAQRIIALEKRMGGHPQD